MLSWSYLHRRSVGTFRRWKFDQRQLVPDVEVPEEVASYRPDISVTTAREKKIDKYAPVARLLSAGGYRTSVDAFVVESLGAWDSANWTTLSCLGVDQRSHKTNRWSSGVGR
ncbi:hypothetical protein J6590_058450 [Homalodisca vitripennis]|nr:hypothetical protein J6590_058450 [Homalodisca vitripennis]